MIHKVTDFPQYRKFSNDKVFYKIINSRCFEEIQLIGLKAKLHKIEATKYPEILRIKEMLDNDINGIIPSDIKEYNSYLTKISD